MKNSYPRRNGTSPLTVLGFGFAIVMTIGFLKNNGFKLTRGDVDVFSGTPGVMTANVAGTPTRSDRADEIVLDNRKTDDYDGRSYDNSDAYRSSSSQPRAARAVRSNVNADEWIAEFHSAAVSQAVSRGVPAALSLAVGLDQLDRGVNILNWTDFVEKVIDPLAQTKQRASGDIRSSYFKYSANSELWAEGLGALGKYSEKELQATMKQFALAAYDEQVRKALVSSRHTGDEATEEQAAYVAEEITSGIRQEKRERPRAETVAIGGHAADQVREKDEQAYYDEFVGREVAREIARGKLKNGKYIGEADMNRLIEETNTETEEVVKHRLTIPGRKINREHPDAAQMLDITKKENAAAREELYQQKLRENKLDSRSKKNQ
ncbi:MAG: hypothetical protein R2824_19520 [Saprospiraceae bacterium]|nr:hypothetical protein [Lewinella sp.]